MPQRKPSTEGSWGDRVRRRRDECHFSQERLAAETGLRQSTISKIELGDMVPSVAVRFIIAAKLRTTPEQLFPEEQAA